MAVPYRRTPDQIELTYSKWTIYLLQIDQVDLKRLGRQLKQTKLKQEILIRTHGILREGVGMKYAWRFGPEKLGDQQVETNNDSDGSREAAYGKCA